METLEIDSFDELCLQRMKLATESCNSDLQWTNKLVAKVDPFNAGQDWNKQAADICDPKLQFAIDSSNVAKIYATKCFKESEDSDWDSDERPPVRMAPVGAPNDDEDKQSNYSDYDWYQERVAGGDGCGSESERLQQLEEEQEQLTSSLISLTSHFAQVQFRLKQIVDSSPSEKENLLKELEEFANRGIPDLREASSLHKSFEEHHQMGPDSTNRIQTDHERQRELIGKLKLQLEDLESYAYQTGEGGLPQSTVLEKQKVVIDQLRGRLNFNMDDLDKLSVDDLKGQVDGALRQLVNPLRMKEQLVSQLQTQIVDLERFIEFLQVEGPSQLQEGVTQECSCNAQSHKGGLKGGVGQSNIGQGKMGSQRRQAYNSAQEAEKLRKETEGLVKRASVLLQMLSLTQFGCGPGAQRFRKNVLKKTPQGNHWGDLRAAVELSIDALLAILGPETLADSDYTSDSEACPPPGLMSSLEMATAVRKGLAPALRDLVQHGLMPVGQSQSLVPFLSCFPQRSRSSSRLLHAWDLLMQYYHLKKGDQYNRTPARKLSQSFNLQIVGGAAVTNKQTLLGVLGSIIASHTPLKRSADAHFKAFVCAALNKKKLIMWLRLIFRTQHLLENYYQPWSYVAKTGFEDTFRSLERLEKYTFDLPIDLAVRPFKNIKDAF